MTSTFLKCSQVCPYRLAASVQALIAPRILIGICYGFCEEKMGIWLQGEGTAVLTGVSTPHFCCICSVGLSCCDISPLAGPCTCQDQNVQTEERDRGLLPMARVGTVLSFLGRRVIQSQLPAACLSPEPGQDYKPKT